MVRGSARGACLCSETSPCRIRAARRTRRTRPACTSPQPSGTWDTRPWRLCLRGGHGGRGGPALEVARVPLARFAVVSSAQARQGLVVRVLLVVQEELVADRAGKPEHAVEIDFRFCKYTPWSHGERGETLASPLVLPRPSPCAPHRSGPAPRLPPAPQSPPRARRRRSASRLSLTGETRARARARTCFWREPAIGNVMASLSRHFPNPYAQAGARAAAFDAARAWSQAAALLPEVGAPCYVMQFRARERSAPRGIPLLSSIHAPSPSYPASRPPRSSTSARPAARCRAARANGRETTACVSDEGKEGERGWGRERAGQTRKKEGLESRVRRMGVCMTQA